LLRNVAGAGENNLRGKWVLLILVPKKEKRISADNLRSIEESGMRGNTTVCSSKREKNRG